jgi:hypothetical protein
VSPSSSAGPAIVAAGLVIVVIGLVAWSGGLSWFGRLPGDVRIERESTRVYAPIVSMLVLSLVASLVLYVVRRFF